MSASLTLAQRMPHPNQGQGDRQRDPCGDDYRDRHAVAFGWRAGG